MLDAASAVQGRSADARLTELVAAELRRQPYSCLKRLACECQDGVVQLRGQVPSYFLKQLAQWVAAQVDGVQRVENRVEVQPRRAG
jgi:osmotically-inducible protein OsmY